MTTGWFLAGAPEQPPPSGCVYPSQNGITLARQCETLPRAAAQRGSWDTAVGHCPDLRFAPILAAAFWRDV